MRKFISLAIVSITLAAGASTSLAQSRPVDPPPSPPTPDVRAENVDRPGPIARERVRAVREREAARSNEDRPERTRERAAGAARPGPERREMIERRIERLDADRAPHATGGGSPSEDRIRELERRIEKLSERLDDRIKERNDGDDRRAPRADRDDRARRFADRDDAPGKQRHRARAMHMRGKGGHHGLSRDQLMRFWRHHHGAQQRFQAGPRAFAGRAEQGFRFQAPGGRMGPMGQMGPLGGMGGMNRPDVQRQAPGAQRFGGRADGPFDQQAPARQFQQQGPRRERQAPDGQQNEGRPTPRRTHRSAS